MPQGSARIHERAGGYTLPVTKNMSGSPLLSRSARACPPSDVPRFDPDSRAQRHVIEVAGSVVPVQDVRVVEEVGLEKVQTAVEVVVPHRDPHAGLFGTVLADGASAFQAASSLKVPSPLFLKKRLGLESQATKMSCHPSPSKSAATAVSA